MNQAQEFWPSGQAANVDDRGLVVDSWAEMLSPEHAFDAAESVNPVS